VSVLTHARAAAHLPLHLRQHMCTCSLPRLAINDVCSERVLTGRNAVPSSTARRCSLAGCYHASTACVRRPMQVIRWNSTGSYQPRHSPAERDAGRPARLGAWDCRRRTPTRRGATATAASPPATHNIAASVQHCTVVPGPATHTDAVRMGFEATHMLDINRRERIGGSHEHAPGSPPL